MLRALLYSQLYFPARAIAADPAAAGMAYADLWFEAEDGERLHGWWVPARGARRGHVLLCHGNGGNVGDRIESARLLTAAGLDVLVFDYRGYGRSHGRPSEDGTYRDARAARSALLRQADVDPRRVLYLGESLGGAVALALALALPPAGLILQSAFTSVRDMARVHYPFLPRALVPDAYPSARLVGGLRAPLLVLHGERDEIVPVRHGRALFAAAPEPKHLHVFPGAGHELVGDAGSRWAAAIAAWVSRLDLG